MQVAFSWQSHSPVSMSQSGPLHPTSHSQVKPVAPSVHVPCTQGSQDPLPQLTPSQASPPAPAVPSMVPPEPPEVPPLPPPLPPLPPPLPPVPPAPSSSSGIEHRSPAHPSSHSHVNESVPDAGSGTQLPWTQGSSAQGPNGNRSGLPPPQFVRTASNRDAHDHGSRRFGIIRPPTIHPRGLIAMQEHDESSGTSDESVVSAGERSTSFPHRMSFGLN